jgi:hypothetical protein
MIPTSLPTLPDPASVIDAKSASDALSDALAAVATASESLSANAPSEPEPKHPHLDRTVGELGAWFRDFHKLLVQVAAKHDQLMSWSVTVGTPFNLTLTVNFEDKDRN